MGQLRMIALAALATSCRAEAGSPAPAPHPIDVPAGWHPLLDLAAAASNAAKAGGVTVDAAGAWGEPAMGCYALQITLQGAAGSLGTLADQLLDRVTHEPRVTIKDVVKPAPDAERGVLALAFERAPYHGRLRAELAKTGSIAALACFWNQREPAACDAACTKLLGSQP